VPDRAALPCLSEAITPFLAKGCSDVLQVGTRAYLPSRELTAAGLRRILTGLPPTDRSVIRVTPADFAHFVLSTIIHTL
jgi:hypothetical protein